MGKLKRVFPKDYRHYICTGITLLFLGLGFLFPNSLPRIYEAGRDAVVSAAYYIMAIINRNNNPVRPTVVAMPSIEWATEIWEPLKLFPFTWEEFKVLWVQYWQLWVSPENLEAFWYHIGDVMYYASRYLMVIIPLALALYLKVKSYMGEVDKPRKKGKTKQLSRFEGFMFKWIYPVISWFKGFAVFLRENDKYYKAWLTLWLVHFNIISILLEVIAYFLYFSVCFDVVGLYTQLLKLLHDLTPMIRFLPGIVWTCFGVWLYNYICRDIALHRIEHEEKCNRAFLNDRGIVTTVYGNMGTGKTQLITSMALSAEIGQFDDAFKIMLECDLKYPNFPWHTFRDYLKRQVKERNFCDLDSVRKKIGIYKKEFNWIIRKGLTPSEWSTWRKAHKDTVKTDFTFGYDFEHYAYTYNDELQITHLYDTLSDYACAYLIFTVKTSLIFSNYSIRVDSIIKDLGNLPIRDNDFFSRTPGMFDAFDRQRSHIINYDMLRLGKRMQKDFKLSFGVYVITEIDKERKNALELQEEKIKQDEANQKNDLFNACIMMCRHAAYVANRVFIRIICDLQRPDAWGAAGRELGEVIFIEEKGEPAPALPFFSLYWITEWLFSGIRGFWNNFTEKYDYNRREGTLFDYLFTNVISKGNNHYDKVNGKFGHFTLKLELQSGRMDGDTKKGKWYIIFKKDRSGRYKSDCLNAVFDTYEPNRMHVDDFKTYAGSFGSFEENGLQNSYFQNDIRRMRGMAA